MFLLNRKVELVVLISVIGILLPTVFIQPAQGITCYYCDPCNDTNVPVEWTCGAESTHCAISEVEKPDRTTYTLKACVPAGRASSGMYSCDRFRPNPRHVDRWRVKMCFCDWDLCNVKNEPSGRSAGSGGRNQVMNGTSTNSSASAFHSPQQKQLSVNIIAALFSVGLASLDW